jgi:hypothetical protein
VATAKQIEANRRNARFSTGPRTEIGKKIASRNAFRHGLSVPRPEDEALPHDVEILAKSLAGDDLLGGDIEAATIVASTCFDIDRIRIAREDLLADLDLTTATPEQLQRLLAIDRYEIRARSKRRQAVRNLRSL